MVLKRRLSRVLTFVLVISIFSLLSLLLTSPPTENKELPYDFLVLNKSVFSPLKPPPDKLNNSKYDDLSVWKDLFSVAGNLKDIVESINYLNFHHEVRNKDKFGPMEDVNLVIVVQVHSRLEYLKYLISTLRQSAGIEHAVIIFSHDMYHSGIDDEIRQIDFCRVIQIFFPYNTQIFGNTFPGPDPVDCSPNISYAEAESKKCENYLNHDTYGHYRIPGISQIKHHWWWKMNYVFDGIINRYGLQNVYAVLLEEDHYVSPDFVHVLSSMIESKDIFCPSCKVITLGIYLKNYKSFEKDIDRLGVNSWFSSKHNMGMAINMETWEEIRNCSRLFCGYDDYNWDWSLLQVSLKCMGEKMKVLFAKSPRVIHIGECGVHTHRCGLHNAAESARELFEKHNSSLFPQKLVVSEISSRMLKASKPNGGWGDIRDQELCLSNAFPLANMEKSQMDIFEPRKFKETIENLENLLNEN
ncbi:hypothetical protein FO519_002161 [Halicephalobus sp. NKZ332]|nr:hypothetical protein FO519_002161 [Halicephalobus sp. NKZ332]